MSALRIAGVTRFGSAFPWVSVLAAVWALLAMLPAMRSLAAHWIEIRDYNSGFLIALICIAWLGKSLSDSAMSQVRASPGFLVPLALVLALWYALWQGNSLLSAQLLAPIAVWLAMSAASGWHVGRTLIAPCGYFYFAIPIWESLLPILQQVALFGATLSMRLAGIPYTVQGARVIIPEGVFEVQEACSGLRFLAVSLALFTLYGFMERMNHWRLLILLSLTAALALLANWLRIFIVMYAGHVTKMTHYFVVESHEGIGHAVFALLLVTLFLLSRWLIRGGVHASPHTEKIGGGSSSVPTTSAVSRFAMPAVAALCLSVVALNVRAAWFRPALETPRLAPLPAAQGDWQGPVPITQSREWNPFFADALQVERASYWLATAARQKSGAADYRMEVYINLYGEQTQGKELVYFRNTLLAPFDWQHVRRHASLGSPLATRLNVDEYLVTGGAGDGESGGQRWLLGYTYAVGGHGAPTGIEAQLLYGFSTLTRPAPAGVIALALRCGTECQAEHALMSHFWAEVGPAMIASIPTNMQRALQSSVP